MLLNRQSSETGIVYYVSPLLSGVGVAHAFSTRIGGVSTGPFNSLNLGNPVGDMQDPREHIQENYRRFFDVIGAGGKTRCWVHQVHGGDVVLTRRGHEFTSGANADALVSDDPQRLLSIRTADCVPVLIASEDGRVVSAVHAGWRGVVAGVVTHALRELHRLTDRKLFAAIGPCIDQCAFEVGPEVIKQFDKQLVDDRHVDLRKAVQMQLMQGGLSEDQIDTTDRCTYRDEAEFFSHRRDKGVTGRMAAVICPRP